MYDQLTFDESQGKRLFLNWKQFDLTNPWVYRRIVSKSFQLWNTGRRHYSMRTICSVLRFEWDIKTSGEEVMIEGELQTVKLCNNHFPYWARKLVAEYPQFEGFFSFRTVQYEPTKEELLGPDKVEG